MQRAAILIGVERSGDLPRLRAVLPGIERLANWARVQGFAEVITLTDDEATGHRSQVTVRDVLDAVAGVVRTGVVDQLLVYFAGHGVNVGRSEFWLLSDAPAYASEVVDVARSVLLAETCGIPHLVIISDACRTAAEGIRMQSVCGVPIFPNEDVDAPTGVVDHFVASALGSPSYEIRDPQVAAARYRAVYTEALVEALCGEAERALERDGPTTGYVRPWPLRDHLEEEVGQRLARLVPDAGLIQVPGARIGSRPTAWLSRLEDLPSSSMERDIGGGSGSIGPWSLPKSLPAVVRAAVHEHFVRGSAGPAVSLQSGADFGVPGAGALLVATTRLTVGSVYTPVLGDAQIRVDGDHLDGVAVPRDTGTDRIDGRTETVLFSPGTRAVTVLAELASGTGVLLPVLDRHRTELTVEDGEVVAIVCEPLDHPIDLPYRALRALVIVASRMGAFSVAETDLVALVAAARRPSGVDPVLASFAAHTATGPHFRIEHALTNDLLSRQFGRSLVDLPTPSADTSILHSAKRRDTLMPFPLLAHGWPLLDQDHPGEAGEAVPALRAELAPSIWTQFTRRGTELVRRALQLR